MAAAGAFMGVGPAVVEDVLAVGMALEVERRRAEEAPIGALEGEMLRQPAVFRRRRPALLERVEEGMREKGIVGAGAGIPVGGRNRGDAIDHPDGEGAAAARHLPPPLPPPAPSTKAQEGEGSRGSMCVART